MNSCTKQATPQRARVEWQQIACPLCGQANEELCIEVSGPEQPYRMVRCRDCGMSYMNPRPVPASMGQFYPPDYHCYQMRSDRPRGRWGRARRRLEQWVMSHHFGCPPALDRWYQKALAIALGWRMRPGLDSMTGIPYQGQGRLLDYGCGAGWYLNRMRHHGWNVMGMDFSAYTAERVREHYGIPVLVGTLPHAQVSPESLDVITMGSVLEHVHWPHEVIRAATNALCPGGSLVISVPNVASWGFRFFREDWWPLELPLHLLHFTPATLRRLVEAHGLEVTELRMLARSGWMRRSMNIAARRRDTPFSRRLVSRFAGIRPLVSILTRGSVWTRQADCLFLIAHKPKTCGARSQAA